MTVRKGLLVVLLGGAAFFASWWNGYMPPTSGGEAVVLGRLADFWPYRDYFFQAPPGMPMLVQAIGAVFGPHLIALLTVGAILRLGAAAALYGLLLRVARPSHAAVATIAALMVSSTDISDTTFYYNHLGTACVLIGTFLGLVAAAGRRWPRHLAAFSAGALLTFAVVIKQTMVFGSAGAGIAMIALAPSRSTRFWTSWILGLAVGGAATLCGVWAWLAAHGLVEPMIQAMRAAPAAKGGILRSLGRPLLAFRSEPLALICSIAAWVLIAVWGLLWVRSKSPDFRKLRPLTSGLAIATLVVVGAIVVGLGARSVTLLMTALGWWGGLALALACVRQLRNERSRAMFGLGVLSFGVGYSFAVSWPLFENMALPGLAVLLAVLFEDAPAARRRTAIVAAIAMVCMTVAVYRKFTAPHVWGHWTEPPLYSPRGKFEDPALAGIRLSAPAADLYQLARDVVERHSPPGEPIFVFPNMPLLYAVTDRRPATYALADNADTTPPFLGAEDAARLRANPPAVLIVRDDSPQAMTAEEQAYLGGGRSSVRDVLDALDAIKPLYERVAVFTNPATRPIEFYVRKR